MGFLTGAGRQIRNNAYLFDRAGLATKINDAGIPILNPKDVNLDNYFNGAGGPITQGLKQQGFDTNDAQRIQHYAGAVNTVGGYANNRNLKSLLEDEKILVNDNSAAGKAQADKDAYPRGFLENESYLPDFNEGQGVTSYLQNVFNQERPNAQGLANDLRNEDTEAINWIRGFKPPAPTTEELVTQKKQANALARAEIDAVKRYMKIDSDDEAIGIANTNRQQNENYGDVLLENSNYVRERLNQGDEELAGKFIAANSALNAGRANVSDLNTAGLGIMRGGFAYKENPEQPARMAGERVQDLIGAGSFADVYKDTENPSLVRKEQPSVVEFRGTIMGNRAKEEADFMVDAMRLGVGPKIDYLERSPNGDTVIGMQNINENYRSLSQAQSELSPQQLAKVPIQVNQQLGALGLRGIALGDRHGENIQLNKTTNRPIQLDFGPEQQNLQGASRVSGDDQAFTIGDRAAKAMIAAGLADEGKLLNSSVVSLLREGRTDDAMDVAKQGFALAQKIKSPVSQPNNVLSAPSVYDLDETGSVSPRNATIQDLYDTKRLVSPAY